MAPRAIPGLRLVLLLSVLANLFLGGMVAGRELAAWHRGGAHAGRAAAGGRPLLDAGATLPPADRARFVAAMRDALRANRRLRIDARETRTEAFALFTAPAFDQAAVAAALAHARADDLALRERLEDAAVGFAATLPPDERAQLASGLEHGGPLRHPRR